MTGNAKLIDGTLEGPKSKMKCSRQLKNANDK